MPNSILTEWERLKALLLSSHPTVQLVLRFFAALAGGYLFTYSFIRAFSLWLPWPHAAAVFFCALILPLVYLAAIIWAFAAANAQHAWKVLIAAAALFWGASFLGSYLR